MIYTLLLLTFVTEYIRPTVYYPALEALKINSMIPVSAFLGTLLTSNRASQVVNDLNSKIILTILGLVWVSSITADVQEFAWNSFTKLLGFGTIYWVVANQLTSVARITGVFKALIAVHLAVAALNPLLFTDPNVRHYISSGNFLGDGNDFALSIDIIVPLCLFLMLDSRWTKWLWAGCLLVLVAGVVATQSRGGTVGLACMAIYYWAKSRKKVQFGIIAAALVALILALAPAAYFERMNMIADTQEGSASARIMAWRVAVQMAMDNPLLGVGAGSFGVKFGNEYRPADAVGRGMNAHSIYFSALGELGFPGLATLISFFGFNLAANRRLANDIKARNPATREADLQLLASTSAALIALAAAGAFLSAFYYPHLYVLGGILTGTRRVLTERSLTMAHTRQPTTPRMVSRHRALESVSIGVPTR